MAYSTVQYSIVNIAALKERPGAIYSSSNSASDCSLLQTDTRISRLWSAGKCDFFPSHEICYSSLEAPGSVSEKPRAVSEVMYFPIGTPEVFEQPAASQVHSLCLKHSIPRPSNDSSSRSGEDHGEVEEASTPQAQDNLHTDDDGHILAVRLSRTGQILVTITASTLTVWQVKVSRRNLVLASFYEL